jgi:dipeptidyl aminopeptidase/acylaminoacyl peptidase
MMRLRSFLPLIGLTAQVAFGAAAVFDGDDITRLADLTEPGFSPDGEYVVYTVSTENLTTDEPQSDIWRVRWDGSERVALTRTSDASEWRPVVSPAGASIAFLSDRGGEDALTQVWLMPAFGGEAHQITDFPGGVEDYAWSPDGRRIAVIANDPDVSPPDGAAATPPPIVIDRYQFKEDFKGYLDERRSHLYVVDVNGEGAPLQLTRGAHDEYLPAWAPDGHLIAYVTKRGDDPDRTLNFDIYLIEPQAGAEERQLTTFPGSDLDPYWESRPAFSPDGKRIAYLQSGEDKWIYYTPWQLAVIDIATGKTRLPAPIDRCFFKPRWSPDGRSVLSLIERDRVTHLARIDLTSGRVTDLTTGARFEYDFDIARNGRMVVLGGTDRVPYTIAALERRGLRELANHNEFLAERRLQGTDDIEFKSADGTTIGGLLMKPVDYVAGKRYPTILRLHGGPVYQFSHEFMADWQVYAAHGYAVVAPNPRGSSGRGFDFAKAIYANWGRVDVADALAAVDHAVALGVADPDRLGVGGRSYGGILTNYVVASDKRFKAAVSGAGTSNVLANYGTDQYVREYELELGRPWENLAAYERVSYPFLKADRITTPTLFYCEEKDVNVPCFGSEQMYEALRSQDVPTRLVIYPGEYHPLTVPSYIRDRIRRQLEWYGRYLK